MNHPLQEARGASPPLKGVRSRAHSTHKGEEIGGKPVSRGDLTALPIAISAPYPRPLVALSRRFRTCTETSVLLKTPGADTRVCPCNTHGQARSPVEAPGSGKSIIKLVFNSKNPFPHSICSHEARLSNSPFKRPQIRVPQRPCCAPHQYELPCHNFQVHISGGVGGRAIATPRLSLLFFVTVGLMWSGTAATAVTVDSSKATPEASAIKAAASLKPFLDAYSTADAPCVAQTC